MTSDIENSVRYALDSNLRSVTHSEHALPTECLLNFETFCFETTRRSKSYLQNRVQLRIVEIVGSVVRLLGSNGLLALIGLLAGAIMAVGLAVVGGAGLLVGAIGWSDLTLLLSKRDVSIRICEILNNAKDEWESYQPGENHREEILALMNRLVALIVEEVFEVEIANRFAYQTPKQVSRTLTGLDARLKVVLKDCEWDGQKVLDLARDRAVDFVAESLGSQGKALIFMEAARKLLVEEVLRQFQEAGSIQDMMIRTSDMRELEDQLRHVFDRCRAKTQRILEQPPSNHTKDLSVIVHVLSDLSKQMGKEVLFFNSSEDDDVSFLPDAVLSCHSALNADTQNVDLRLESIQPIVAEALDDEKTTMNVNDERDLLGRLNLVVQGGAAKTEREDAVLAKLKAKIAAVHGVAPEDIKIKRFYDGCCGIEYSVDGLSEQHIKQVQREDVDNKLKEQFDGFINMKIHPLFYRNYFDLNMFDERGNKCFAKSKTFKVGPPGKTRKYTQPKGWHRYGLKVRGRYNNDKWLHPFGNDGMWYKAYHGTRRAVKVTDLSEEFNSLSALSGIYENGFQESDGKNGSRAVYNSGVYCSPNIEFVRSGYSAQATLQTTEGAVKWEFMIMVAVRPGSFAEENGGKIWVVQSKEDIRPYGYLVRKC